MKKLLTIASLCLAAQAFAHHGKSYRGKGYYTSLTGKTGHYHVQVDGHKDQNSFHVTHNYSFKDEQGQEHHKQASFNIVAKDHGFFDVTKEGAVIGTGYCNKRVMSKSCHYNFTTAEGSGETTFYMNDLKMDRLGSFTHGDHTMRFNDTLYRTKHQH